MSTQAIGNTGLPNGQKVGNVVVKGFLVQTFADDRTRNEINLTGAATTLTSVALEAHLVNPDASKRWYPLPKFYDAELPKADPTFDTASDGTNFFIQDGIRSFSAIHKQQDTILLKALDTAECGGVADWSIFLVDECEQIFVEEVEAGKGRPQKISGGTFNSIYQYASNTATNNITIKYDFSKFVKDSRIQLVQVDSDASILEAIGVTPATAVISAITTTTFTATMTFDAGYVGNKQVFTGAVIGDFDLDEISPTPASIVITTVTENPAASGIYDFVFPLETTADVLELTSSTVGIATKFQVRPASILIP